MQTKGKCKYCGKLYAKGYMLRHLKSCKERLAAIEKTERKGKKCGYYTLAIYGKYDKQYWLIIEVSENATLEELDQFLRDIWLECCGHLSSFHIDGTLYDVCPDDDPIWGTPTRSMNYRLMDLIEKGMTFEHEYDFGSTTTLTLDVNDYREGKRKPEYLTILSRNVPMEYMCHVCGKKKAEYICPACIYEEASMFCEECAEKHGYKYNHEDVIVPICNSPRIGVCCYEGSEIYPEEFVPDTEL